MVFNIYFNLFEYCNLNGKEGGNSDVNFSCKFSQSVSLKGMKICKCDSFIPVRTELNVRKEAFRMGSTEQCVRVRRDASRDVYETNAKEIRVVLYTLC